MSDFQNATYAPILLDYANAFIPDVRLHGGDANGRIIRVQLLDNGVPVDDTNIEVYLTYNWQLGVLIGGRVKMAAADSPDGRVWQVAVPAVACAHPGSVTLGFEVKRENTVVCSRNFTAIVERPVVDYGSAESVLTHADLVDAAREAREQAAKVSALTNEFSRLVSESEAAARKADEAVQRAEQAVSGTTSAAGAATDAAGKATAAADNANAVAGRVASAVDAANEAKSTFDGVVRKCEQAATDANSAAAEAATAAAGKVAQALQESETRLKAVEQSAADAKSVAGTANSTADAARTTAEQAQSKANDAASAAQAAQSAADAASGKGKENANRIQTLDAALSASRKGLYMRAGENVQITQMTQNPMDGVTISVPTLTAVKSTAEQAQSKANDAASAAQAAQSAADAANSKAQAVQSTADSASQAASAAQSAAQTAQSKAQQAADAASQAGATANSANRAAQSAANRADSVSIVATAAAQAASKAQQAVNNMHVPIVKTITCDNYTYPTRWYWTRDSLKDFPRGGHILIYPQADGIKEYMRQQPEFEIEEQDGVRTGRILVTTHVTNDNNAALKLVLVWFAD